MSHAIYEQVTDGSREDQNLVDQLVNIDALHEGMAHSTTITRVFLISINSIFYLLFLRGNLKNIVHLHSGVVLFIITTTSNTYN